MGLFRTFASQAKSRLTNTVYDIKFFFARYKNQNNPFFWNFYLDKYDPNLYYRCFRRFKKSEKNTNFPYFFLDKRLF